MGNTNTNDIASKADAEKMFLNMCHSKYHYDILKQTINNDTLGIFLEEDAYILIIYSFFNKYGEVNILYSKCKESKLFNYVKVVKLIEFYYNIRSPAVNDIAKDKNIYFLWKSLDHFVYTSTFPQFIINFCDKITELAFINIFNKFIESYIIRSDVLVVDQLVFLQLLGCHLENKTPQLKVQIEKIINRYLDSKIMQYKVIKFLVEWNLFDAPIEYNKFKYSRFVLKQGHYCGLITELSDRELLMLLMGNNFAACMLVDEIKYRGLSVIPIVDYAFPQVIYSNVTNINLVENYYEFLSENYTTIPSTEVDAYVKSLIDYNIAANSFMKINMGFIAKLFSKTNVALLSVFDYYLSKGLKDYVIIDIFLEAGIGYDQASADILVALGIKTKTVSYDQIQLI